MVNIGLMRVDWQKGWSLSDDKDKDRCVPFCIQLTVSFWFMGVCFNFNGGVVKIARTFIPMP